MRQGSHKLLMRYSLVFLLTCMPFFSQAREDLSWQALEVTVVEEPEPEPIDTTSSFKKMGSEFKSLYSELMESAKNRREEKNRTVEPINKETVYSAIVEMLEESFPGGLDARVQANEDMEEAIYRLVLMLPDYAYQYVGPFMHDVPFLPDRILNIPGIKATKGKFPTRIAPQMQSYAEKYKPYMSSHLYTLLMPEAWATKEKEKSTFKGYSKVIVMDENTTADDLFYIYNPSLLDKHKILSPEAYRTGEALKNKRRPQTPAEEVTEASSLTEGDVEAMLSSVQTLETVMGTNRFDTFRSSLRRMSLHENSMMAELLNPMHELVDKVKRMPEKDKFEKAISQHGFTLDSWAMTMDKVIKARRVQKMSPAVALTLKTWRRFKTPPPSFNQLSPQDRKVAWDTLQLFLGMYVTTQENVLAVKNYSDNIRETFATRDMLFFEMPVYGIY